MSRCADCKNWVVQRKTVFGDGHEVVDFQAPEGKGHCDVLNMDFAPDFGCNSFDPGADHVMVENKPMASWQYWQMVPCPTCNGGQNADGRCKCAGTGKVRLYGDGFVGDEQRNRQHPKEREKPPESPDPGTVLIPPVNQRGGAIAQ